MQKTLRFLVAFFAVLLLKAKQKKPFVTTKVPFYFSDVFFFHTLFLENKQKTSEK